MSAPIQLTKQQAFDQICEHLKKQRACSMNEFGNCRYRGPDGMKCAVGALIPDKLYSPHMEGLSAGSWKINKLFPPALSGLLYDCQQVHDGQSVQDNPKFKAGLKAVAAKFGLVWRHG